MKLSNEVKIGLIGIATIAALIWGINYLKGRNILRSTYTLHTFFSDALGLESSAPVVMNGVRVGYVDLVSMDPAGNPPVEVILQIEKSYPLPEAAYAVLFSADLLGTKAIRIEVPRQGAPLQDSDTLQSLVEPDLLSSIEAQLLPAVQRISDLAVTLDHLALQMDTLAGADATREAIQHLSEVSGALSRSLATGGSMDAAFRNVESFTAMLKEQEDELASLAGHLRSIGASLDSAGVGKLAGELRTTSSQLNQVLAQINSGEGNAGRFIYSDSLYLSLKTLVSDLDELVVDLNENPQDYVHFSLFGNSQKKNR